MSDLEILAGLVKAKTVDCGVLVADLHPADFCVPARTAFPVLTDLVFHIAVRSGIMEIEVDGVKYRCTPEENNLVDVKPMNTVSFIRLSTDFSGSMLALSRMFIESSLRGRKQIKPGEILALKINTAVTLSEEDMQSVLKYFQITRENSGYVGNGKLDMAIFCYAALLLHLNIIRIVYGKIKESGVDTSGGNAARLMERFLQLLEENAAREHAVHFYAERLCITPHYLSIISNRFTGRSAGKLITEELMSKAYTYLRSPDYTIQEIADRLNFSDQSSFGKFFRKHSGTSPAAYRRAAIV